MSCQRFYKIWCHPLLKCEIESHLFLNIILKNEYEFCWELGQSFPKDSLIQWQFLLHPPAPTSWHKSTKIENDIMRKCRKRHSGDILGETISIIYFSLDHILFQNIVQTCTHTCVRYLRGHEEAYSQSTHLVKTFISNSSHRRHTS